MAKEKTATAPARGRELPTHIVIEGDWSRHRAGDVLAVDADILSALDVGGVKYRPATAIERGLGGFAD